MELNQLSDNPGSRKKRTRIGRGLGSGKGKTGGRGVKGQKSRSGVSINGFEGGQMPIHMRMPKRGFNPLQRKNYSVVNLDRLQQAVEAGKLNAGEVIDEAALIASGLVRRLGDGVRILGQGEVTSALKLEVAGASKTALGAIEKAGGSIKILKPKVEKDDSKKKSNKKKGEADVS